MADLLQSVAVPDAGLGILPMTYAEVKNGISASVIKSLIKSSVLTKEDVSMIISPRTFERRTQHDDVLKTEEVDGIIRLLRVRAHAVRLFEDTGLADEWLRTPNPALGGECPIEMARMDIGAREVEDVLTRLEHGIHG